MKNILAARPVKNPLGRLPAQPDDEIIANITQFNGGLFKQYDPSDIEPQFASHLINFRVSGDRLVKRRGFVSVAAAANPNSLPILGVMNLRTFAGAANLIRGTANSIHNFSNNAWTAMTGYALALTPVDRYKLCAFNNRFFFTTNGTHPISEFNIGANTYAALGNAPNYRYLVGFHNRLVGASLAGVGANPVQIGWSGILNFAEWNPLVDPSAGSTPLLETNDDYLDPITGLFTFGGQLVLVRENSIWLASKLASAATPFQFYNQVPNIGCDCPNAIAQMPAALVWYSYRLGGVYVYDGGNDPADISGPIKDYIRGVASAPEYISGSFNKTSNEYTLIVYTPLSASTQTFVYNFTSKTWAQHTYPDVCYVTDFDYNGTRGTIDGLPATIATLTNSIIELTLNTVTYTKFFGTTKGDVCVEETSADADTGKTTSTAVTSTVVSKNFQLPNTNAFVSKFTFEYASSRAGTYTIEYSIDGGQTFKLYRTGTTAGNEVRKVVACNKLIRARNFMWRLTVPSGAIEILSYAVYTNPAGETRTGR
jgi:hypothetical protein